MSNVISGSPILSTKRKLAETNLCLSFRARFKTIRGRASTHKLQAQRLGQVYYPVSVISFNLKYTWPTEVNHFLIWKITHFSFLTTNNILGLKHKLQMKFKESIYNEKKIDLNI